MHNQSSKPTKHTLATRIFHHGSVVFIVVLWALAEFSDSLEGMLSTHPIGVHKALGAIFLFWVIGRIVNLIIRPRMPALNDPKWQIAAAHLTHFGLYVCMLLMPITGILMSVYGGRAVDIFGIVQIPVFVSPDRDMASFFNALHTNVIFPLLVLMVVAHVAAALYHQFILKDNLLSRMK